MDEMEDELLLDKTRFLPLRVMKVNVYCLLVQVGPPPISYGHVVDVSVSACPAT
jgi:hypothetical protein